MLFVILLVIRIAVLATLLVCIPVIVIHSVTPIHVKQLVMALVMITGAIVIMQFMIVLVILVVILNAFCITLVSVILLVKRSLANCGGINGCKNIT